MTDKEIRTMRELLLELAADSERDNEKHKDTASDYYRGLCRGAADAYLFVAELLLKDQEAGS